MQPRSNSRPTKFLCFQRSKKAFITKVSQQKDLQTDCANLWTCEEWYWCTLYSYVSVASDAWTQIWLLLRFKCISFDKELKCWTLYSPSGFRLVIFCKRNSVENSSSFRKLWCPSVNTNSWLQEAWKAQPLFLLVLLMLARGPNRAQCLLPNHKFFFSYISNLSSSSWVWNSSVSIHDYSFWYDIESGSAEKNTWQGSPGSIIFFGLSKNALISFCSRTSGFCVL